MSQPLNVSIIVNDGEKVSESCDYVKFFSTQGEVGVTDNHITSVLDVNFTDFILEYNDQVKAKYYLGSGIVSIRNNDITVLVDECLESKDLNVKELKQELADAKECYSDPKKIEQKSNYLVTMLRCETKLRVIE